MAHRSHCPQELPLHSRDISTNLPLLLLALPPSLFPLLFVLRGHHRPPPNPSLLPSFLWKHHFIKPTGFLEEGNPGFASQKAEEKRLHSSVVIAVTGVCRTAAVVVTAAAAAAACGSGGGGSRGGVLAYCGCWCCYCCVSFLLRLAFPPRHGGEGRREGGKGQSELGRNQREIDGRLSYHHFLQDKDSCITSRVILREGMC